MTECDISNSNLTTAFTSSSMDRENVNSELKKRKTHRLKQRFQVVKKLGQGTYGKVQLAINNETGQEVAIKTIKKNKVSNQQDLVRIRREIQIMSSINHPNIIHIFEVFENKDKIVLVMQYANGGELYDYVSFHKVLSDTEARRVFRQIATAIYYCHKNKICHRDLKLENILLDEKGNAKIADFGLSNVFDDKHFLQTFCGSPLYASPEIVRGLPYFGPEVDCWSLGVLLYTLVYGAMPFDGSNFKKLVKQISEANYFEPPEKSAASGLIHKLLTPDPKERASIIDICTDKWVNQDCEHLLLQVAEDLSNLTKHAVRLDMLLALAPGSPTEPQKTSPNKNKENEIEDVSNKRPNEATSANDSLADVAEKKSSKKKTKKSESNEKTNNLTKEEQINKDEHLQEEILNNKDNIKMDEEVLKLDSKTKAEIQQKESADQEQSSKLSNDAIKQDGNTSQTSLKSNESSGSISRRRSKISIPKIWDENQEQTTTMKNKNKKELISPGIFSVSELKKELEQKTKLNNQQIPLVKRRDTLADTTELKLNKCENVKKYKNRSLSLNLSTIKNENSDEQKVNNLQIELKKEDKNEQQQQQEHKTEHIDSGTDIHFEDEKTNESKIMNSSSIKDEKSLAKQIIQKNIAKAKLMEKKQSSIQSVNSGATTPLISIENSTISIMQGSPSSSTSNVFFKKSINDNNEIREFSNEVTNLPINAAPITRSYKKVIFTKDGAKITETGKYYSHEGDDGVTTRVEKKSRITHIINSNANPSTINIQKSDSQSSTGSIDIFDDIFDDHWTGENLFSNVKSLFSDFFGRHNEKLSLRSRAESLERTSLFSGRSSENFRTDRKIQTKENLDNLSNSSSIFGSQKSLFTSKSIFSNSSFSKSTFGKEFNFDDMMSSARSRIEDYKNYRLVRDKLSDADNEKDFFSKSHVFDDDDQLDSTRKRIEQWLEYNNDNKDFDVCMNTYGTIRPRSRRYSRTMTSNDYKSDIFKKIEISNSSSCQVIRQKTSTIKTENMMPRNSNIQINFSLDDSDGNLMVNQSNISVDEKKNVSGTNLNDLKIEEPSSLLEQLRTFGYKKLVNRRLSDSSSTEDFGPGVAESTTSSVSNKSSADRLGQHSHSSPKY